MRSKRSPGRQVVEDVADEQLDAPGQAEPAHVAPRDVERRRDARRWPRRRPSGCSVASAQAMLPEPVPMSSTSGSGSVHRRQRLEADLDEGLGLGTRDQRVVVELELDGAKGAAAEDVRDRLLPLAPARRPPRSARPRARRGRAPARRRGLRAAPRARPPAAARRRAAATASVPPRSARGLPQRRACGRRPRCRPPSPLARGGELLAPVLGGERLLELGEVALHHLGDAVEVRPMRWSVTRFCGKL